MSIQFETEEAGELVVRDKSREGGGKERQKQQGETEEDFLETEGHG